MINAHAVNLAKGLTEKFKDMSDHHTKVFTASSGRTYGKVWAMRDGERATIHAFVDKDGNVYKPAGLNAPAKGIRFSSVEEALKAADPYGGYLYIR